MGNRRSTAAFAGLSALAASLSPLRELKDFTSTEQFMQNYYREMTPADMAKVIARIEREKAEDDRHCRCCSCRGKARGRIWESR